MAEEKARPYRIAFFPFMTPGHMIPLLDMAKLFSIRGVSVTIITSPGNEPLVRSTIDRSTDSGRPMQLLLLPFPSSVNHLLPHGRENLSSISSAEFGSFLTATFSLHHPFLNLLRLHPHDCIVSDSLFAWSADIAISLSIPRLIFHGPGIFALCVQNSLDLHSPHNSVSGDSDTFSVPDLPHRIEMTRSELPEVFLSQFMLDFLRDGESKSYGIVVNSFYELEPAYAELYRSKPGRKAWYVGPVSLCNTDSSDKADRGQLSYADNNYSWLSWLDSKPASSVVYVCFGSLCEVTTDQLREIATGIESSGHPFLWVVKDVGETTVSEWLPEGFEERVREKGVVLRGWAPQILILNHAAVGGFVTHCGWNSTLEGVSAGVPMITWPLSYEQFINEKFVTQVLETGVRVRGGGVVEDRKVVVKGEEIAGAVRRLMGGGEEGEGRRRRAMEFGKMAKAAMEEGGSSWVDMNRLVEELKVCGGEGGGKKKVEVVHDV